MKRIFSLLLLLLALLQARSADHLRSLPAVSTVIAGYESADGVSCRMAAMPLSPIEGLWQMANGDGALFAIVRAEPSTDIAPARLMMVMVRSPWRSIRPGTLLGHLVATPKPGVYEARIYASLAQRTGLSLPRPFSLVLGEDNALLTFKPFKSPLKVNLFRLLPYMYRRVVTLQDSRPEGLDGAVKVYPRPAAHPLSPVYL